MSRAATGRIAPRAKPTGRASDFPTGYFQESELPLPSLIFLLPLLILFEVGAYYHPADTIAFQKMQAVFHLLGANGRFLPALTLVGILLAWHIAKQDRWSVRWETITCMGLESALVSMPLLALGIAFTRWHGRMLLAAGPGEWSNEALLSLGAGIYEELVFRLILMTALILLLSDWLRMKHGLSNLLMVLTSAVLFSLYHYLGSETFQLQSFAFRTLAGIYFAGLFLTRGFGITCGCHIAYDVMNVGLKAYASH